VDATINFSNFASHKEVEKSPLSVFIELLSQQQSQYFRQLKKTQELNFGFQVLVFKNPLLKKKKKNIRAGSPDVFLSNLRTPKKRI